MPPMGSSAPLATMLPTPLPFVPMLTQIDGEVKANFNRHLYIHIHYF